MPKRELIGKETAATTAVIDAGSSKAFARVVGEMDPLYHDVEAARRAGYANVLAPPTYPIAFMAESMDPALFFELDLNLLTIVHGEQEFLYFRPIVAGERLTMKGRVADMWEKAGRSGTLDFVVLESSASDEAGQPVYTSRMTLISKRAEEPQS